MNIGRIVDIIIGIVGVILTIHSLFNAAERIIGFIIGVLIIVFAFALFSWTEINKSKDKLNELKKRLDYKEALHRLDNRMVVLETKMNKRGKEDLAVTLIGAIFLAIVGYVLYVLITTGQLK